MTFSEIAHSVHGIQVHGDRGRPQDVFTPATGTATGRGALVDEAEVGRAVAAARAAFPAWADMPPIHRAQQQQHWPKRISKGAEFTLPVAR